MEKFKDIEENILKYWKENKIYEKVKLLNKGKKYFFLDGPPYATGSIHMGTALNKILKDFYLRFFRFKGFNVWDKPGYDSHGVPIEYKVEQELGFKTKKDIENFGIENFVKKCKEFATMHVNKQSEQFENLGCWMDWENYYITLRNEYIENEWFLFKKIYEKGLLYKGYYPVHICYRCETVVSYNEIEYENLEDPAIYVKFKIKNSNDYLIVFTTTPWTLPDNVAIMVHPKEKYVKVKVNGENWIFSKNLAEELAKKFNIQLNIIEEFEGSKLVGLKYEHPFEDLLEHDKSNIYVVVPSERYVNVNEGTGLVHSAPSHGKEDFEVAKENNLPIINSLSFNCRFKTKFLNGLFARDANDEVIKILKERNALVRHEKIVHSYPICWRCKNPLIINAVDQWFIAVEKIRDKLLENNEKVNWIPEFAKERMRDWIKNLSDWPVSRQRYWGTPTPIWECKNCKNIKVIGSVKELKTEIKDLHRPYIDEIVLKCDKCGANMERVKEVLDVWFDSGVAPWASIDFIRNKKLAKKLFPVDFETEGPDQIRGWWNSQFIISTLVFDEIPIKNILFHGFVLDAHGRKMSKSLGNVVQPEEVIEKYGRDVLRMFFLTQEPWKDYYWDWDKVEEINRNLNIVRNVFEFIKLYVNEQGEKKKMKIEDKYILSKLMNLILKFDEFSSKYHAHEANKLLLDFIINDVSRFYIKLIRDRVWIYYNGDDKKAAFYTLTLLAKNLLILLASSTPFLAEYYYKEFKNILNSKESIFFERFPRIKKSLIKNEIEDAVDKAREISELILKLRNVAQIKLRQPLKEVIIVPKNEKYKIVEKAKRIVKLLTNVKNVKILNEFTPKENYVKAENENVIVLLNVKITKKLKEEGIIKELIRNIQEFRKENKLDVKQKIVLGIVASEKIKDIIEKYKNQIMNETSCENIVYQKFEKSKEVEIENEKIILSIQ